MLFGSLFNVPNSSVLTIDDDKVRRYPEDMKKLGLSVSYQPGGKQGLTVHEAVDCLIGAPLSLLMAQPGQDKISVVRDLLKRMKGAFGRAD